MGYRHRIVIGLNDDFVFIIAVCIQWYFDVWAASPAISTVFENTKADWYWTATNDSNSDANNYAILFLDGYVSVGGRTLGNYTRCVSGSGGQPGNFEALGNDVVNDLATGLSWQSQDDGTTRQWSDAVAYCDSLMLEGKKDWRLPNIKELFSIVDHRIGDAPTISPRIRPMTSMRLQSSFNREIA